MKAGAMAEATEITFDFGISDSGRACIATMENNARYFLKGYYRAPITESRCLSLEQMKLLSLKTFSWLGFTWHPIRYIQIFYTSSGFSYTS
jgi:hypothetical protein